VISRVGNTEGHDLESFISTGHRSSFRTVMARICDGPCSVRLSVST